ncbi:MAG: GGDEF domain-containing protein [Actinobacteria bacterium]|nr:GGDEF domain-containing protein [Actinomycetota bacterium]
MTPAVDLPEALSALGADLRSNSWELSLEIVEAGLLDDTIPSLARLDRLAQFGDVPTFIAELGRELELSQPARMRLGGPLAAITRDHAREREALGFAPREVVTEFLLMRRVLWRFVGSRVGRFASGDVIEIERRLNDAIDRLVIECTVAYFDRATAELAELARRDGLTRLLNRQAFAEILESETARAARYDHGLTLVFFDLDDFKEINDGSGHLEGDRVLCRVSELLTSMLRGSDVAARLGGDEFVVLLLEADPHAGARYLRRLEAGIDELRRQGVLPPTFDLSAGSAHFPTEAPEPRALLNLADARQYAAKRAKP